MATVAGVHAFLCGFLLAWSPDEPAPAEVRRLASFQLQPPTPPPPPPEPPPESRSSAPRQAAGARNRRADPAPAVAPPAIVPAATRLAAADRTSPRRGRAITAGASSSAGPGSGAGGAGDGSGGGGSGGSGDGSGGGLGSEARLLSGNLDRSDYRRIRGFGSPRGSAVLAIQVGPEGTLTGCQPVSGSGNPALDSELCVLLSRTRWDPARDRSGRPVTVALRYVATWDRN